MMINYVTVKDLSEQWKISQRTVYRKLSEFKKRVGYYYPKDAYIASGITRIDEEAFRHYMQYENYYKHHWHVPSKFKRGYSW